MSGGEDSCTVATAVGEKEFTEQQVLDSIAVQWIGGLLKFIEIFWHENGEFNKTPPLDEKLKDILGHIPVEIAFVSSWFGEQLVEWEKSAPKELTADARSAIILVTSVIMICLQFIRVCKEVAEKGRDPESCVEGPYPKLVPGISSEQKIERAEESTLMDFEWETYHFLPSSENISTQYFTLENVQNILDDVKSYCKDQEKFIMEKLFGEKTLTRTDSDRSATEKQSLVEESQGMSVSSEDSLPVPNDGKEIFNNLIKKLVSIFNSTETSQRESSSGERRRLKRLAYAQAKREPSDSEEFLTLVLESMCSLDETSCKANLPDNVQHSTGRAANTGRPDPNVVNEENLGIRIFTVHEVESTDHLILSVPADHGLKWGNEAEAPHHVLLFIRMQNCAAETWEMIAEAKISDSVLSDSSKACIKGVFNSLYKNLQVLKDGVIIKKSPRNSKVSLLLHGLSLKTQKSADTNSESESDVENLSRKCSRILLSHDYGVRKGNLSLLKHLQVKKVEKRGKSIQLTFKVQVSSGYSTTGSEADSEEETRNKIPANSK